MTDNFTLKSLLKVVSSTQMIKIRKYSPTHDVDLIYAGESSDFEFSYGYESAADCEVTYVTCINNVLNITIL